MVTQRPFRFGAVATNASSRDAWIDYVRMVVNADTSIEGILDFPLFLIGTVDQIAEELRVRRERFGVSYITVGADDVEAFGPVVERLTGT